VPSIFKKQMKVTKEQFEKDPEKTTDELVAHAFSTMSDNLFDELMPMYMKDKKFMNDIRKYTRKKLEKEINKHSN